MGACVTTSREGDPHDECISVIQRDVIDHMWAEPPCVKDFHWGISDAEEGFPPSPKEKGRRGKLSSHPDQYAGLMADGESFRGRSSVSACADGSPQQRAKAKEEISLPDKNSVGEFPDGTSSKSSSSGGKSGKSNGKSTTTNKSSTGKEPSSSSRGRRNSGGEKRPGSSSRPATPQKRDWTKGSLIGSGAMGRVYRGLDQKTGATIAIKDVMVTNREILVSLKKEIELLKTIDHENIVKYLAFEREGQQCHILMEYVAGNTLAVVAKMYKLKEPLACKYTGELLKAVEYIHSRDIVHRDIKGANILVSSTGSIKLADFGSAKNLTLGANALVTITGTPFWMAPEVIKESGYGKPADIWSIGCTIIEMLTGEPPYYSYGQVTALKAIARDTGIPPHKLDSNSVTPACYDLIIKCLERNPKLRPGAAKLQKHLWFNDTTANLKVAFKLKKGEAKKKNQSKATPVPERKRMSFSSSDGEALQLLGIADGGSPSLRPTPPLKTGLGQTSPSAGDANDAPLST